MKTAIVRDSNGIQRCWVTYDTEEELVKLLAHEVWVYAQSRPDLVYGETTILYDPLVPPDAQP